MVRASGSSRIVKYQKPRLPPGLFRACFEKENGPQIDHRNPVNRCEQTLLNGPKNIDFVCVLREGRAAPNGLDEGWSCAPKPTISLALPNSRLAQRAPS